VITACRKATIGGGSDMHLALDMLLGHACFSNDMLLTLILEVVVFAAHGPKRRCASSNAKRN
jgi:hypothetical protein